MEEIKVYRSVWKSLFLLIVCFAFAALGILMLRDEDAGNKTAAWVSILFFGLGGLFMLYIILKERLSRVPYIVVTDTKVAMNIGFRHWEVLFVDVAIFYVFRMSPHRFGGTSLIGIKYKKGIEQRKLDNANRAGRAVRRFNNKFYGSQESIPADGLTMSPQRLCDLLNERLAASIQL